MTTETGLRWKLADDQPQGALFADEELVERHVGKGEFRGLEFFHVNARRIVNEVPAASRMPFRYTINAYRGCSHACVYCLAGDTPILMADSTTKALADVRVGDRVYGTRREGGVRRYVVTDVLAHWSTTKAAYRVRLGDGTTLIASGDHRFLSDRGWKYVTGSEQGRSRRPHLTARNRLLGTGAFVAPTKETPDYRVGYLCGIVRGDGHVGSYSYARPGRAPAAVHRFRLALADGEALERARHYLDVEGVSCTTFHFPTAPGRRPMRAIRTSKLRDVEHVRRLVAWPNTPSEDWRAGFLAGIFDAEGSWSKGVLRISNADDEIIDQVVASLGHFGFDGVVEATRPVRTVRVRGGLPEHLRFIHIVGPAITRKLSIEHRAVKTTAALGVVSIEPLNIDLPMYDITTGTGDFIANGVVSHNCFARPTHEYLGLDIGDDFERKLVVKVNAVERLEAELRSPRWAGEHIAMGTNTDPYQRAEGKYHLTQGIVRVLSEARNPFSILTKSTLILRDLDLLAAAARHTDVRANLSIGTLDETVWKATEPGTPHPRRRVEAVRKLNDAGVRCGVLVAPILPGLSDSEDQLEEVVTACVDAGAVSVTPLALHLRPGVREHFMAWLRAERPDLVPEYERRYRRAYLPGKEQDAISATVRRLVAKAGGVVRPPAATRAPAAPSAPPVAGSTQLSLLPT